ncbi:hypothetical protein Nepgr_018449 [Nepenthes gracilis]|uniref:Transmembrane protein n=1 Tax=Nepenthes gracilis TaxID=150966 RepID=A0AAD3SRE2_NEPGR|nr:hypothetical protein Nepgr_018449 [Nepenthes gracilis]
MSGNEMRSHLLRLSFLALLLLSQSIFPSSARLEGGAAVKLSSWAEQSGKHMAAGGEEGSSFHRRRDLAVHIKKRVIYGSAGYRGKGRKRKSSAAKTMSQSPLLPVVAVVACFALFGFLF